MQTPNGLILWIGKSDNKFEVTEPHKCIIGIELLPFFDQLEHKEAAKRRNESGCFVHLHKVVHSSHINITSLKKIKSKTALLRSILIAMIYARCLQRLNVE
jgi:Mlc titration factor MtfA (ptsG expression regulator)